MSSLGITIEGSVSILPLERWYDFWAFETMLTNLQGHILNKPARAVTMKTDEKWYNHLVTLISIPLLANDQLGKCERSAITLPLIQIERRAFETMLTICKAIFWINLQDLRWQMICHLVARFQSILELCTSFPVGSFSVICTMENNSLLNNTIANNVFGKSKHNNGNHFGLSQEMYETITHETTPEFGLVFR